MNGERKEETKVEESMVEKTVENAPEVATENEPVENEVSNVEEFQKAAGQVPIPQSVAMNALRNDINNAISRSPLHIECILEVFRTTCDMLEKSAAETAQQEAMAYDNQIMELRQKFNIQ